jgi:hypothetical protein
MVSTGSVSRTNKTRPVTGTRDPRSRQLIATGKPLSVLEELSRVAAAERSALSTPDNRRYDPCDLR